VKWWNLTEVVEWQLNKNSINYDNTTFDDTLINHAVVSIDACIVFSLS